MPLGSRHASGGTPAVGAGFDGRPVRACGRGNFPKSDCGSLDSSSAGWGRARNGPSAGAGTLRLVGGAACFLRGGDRGQDRSFGCRAYDWPTRRKQRARPGVFRLRRHSHPLGLRGVLGECPDLARTAMWSGCMGWYRRFQARRVSRSSRERWSEHCASRPCSGIFGTAPAFRIGARCGHRIHVGELGDPHDRRPPGTSFGDGRTSARGERLEISSPCSRGGRSSVRGAADSSRLRRADRIRAWDRSHRALGVRAPSTHGVHRRANGIGGGRVSRNRNHRGVRERRAGASKISRRCSYRRCEDAARVGADAPRVSPAREVGVEPACQRSRSANSSHAARLPRAGWTCPFGAGGRSCPLDGAMWR